MRAKCGRAYFCVPTPLFEEPLSSLSINYEQLFGDYGVIISTHSTVLLTGSFCLLLSSISCVRRDTVFMATDVSVLIPLSVAVSFSTCSVMMASRHLEGGSNVWGRSGWNVEEERSVQGQGGM